MCSKSSMKGNRPKYNRSLVETRLHNFAFGGPLTCSIR